MKADRWRQVDKIFHDLIEQTPQDRASVLDRICADDPLLKKEVEDLIQAYERSGSFLDSPAPVSASGSLIGRALGSYELKALLGSGGMGEVYRARDSKLKRDVAIKLLPATFSRDPDRVARFQREAEVLASLNHPNIAAIYDLAVSDDSRFLVLELVEGETLAELLARRPIPMTEALEIAKQIAAALEAAHERGIIHRDLKPANVKITPQGRVKVLDFGLAKVLEDEAGASVSPSNPPTMLTAAGMMMGTAAYMSPEQASGEDTDRQTDVWAFGCVLYEMLTSRRLFDGRNSAEILASVLKSTPDLDRLPAETPVSIRRLLRRCLQRDRNERLHDIGDARLEIADVLAGPPSNERSPVRQVRRWERPAWILTALITLLAGAGVVWVLRPATQPAERRLELSMPPSSAPFSEFAISPDGAKVAFVATNDGRRQLWIRSLNAESESSVPLPGTEFALSLFWSPDSQSVAFTTDDQLKVTDILAGAPRVLAAAGSGGGAWSKDGTILFSNGPLYSIGASGGERTAVTHLEGMESGHHFPTFLRDGKHFLYYAYVAEGNGPSGVYLGELGSPLQRRLLDADTKAVYVPGYVLFGMKGTLFAQGFDAGSLTLRGEPFPLVERIDSQFQSLAVSASNDGTIVYRRAPGGIFQRQFSWFDRQGNELQKVGAPVDGTAGTLSSNGNLVAFNQYVAGKTDVWLLDVERGTVDPFTSNPAVDSHALFSHDGRYIVYTSNRKGKASFDLYRSLVSTPEDADLLMPGAPGDGRMATDWSRDGRNLLITTGKPPRSIWVLPLDEKGNPGSPRPIVKTGLGLGEEFAQFSPDSKWIVYQSNKSGQWEIYVQAFPNSQSQPIRISDAGGKQARWSADGKEIFYVAGNGRLTVVPVQISPKSEFTKGKPMALFDSRIGVPDGANLQFYVVSPDAQKFLIATPVDRPSPPLTVLLNWKGKGLDSRK